MIFVITILAVSLSLDALGVGLSYGLRAIKIPLKSKFIICLFSIIYSGISLVAGKALSVILPAFAAKLIGISILLIMGLLIIFQAAVKKYDESGLENKNQDTDRTLFQFAIKSLGITIQVVKNPYCGDIDKSGIIDTAESFLLGLALSIDAIGVGIGSALTGFHSFFIPPAVGLFQLGFLYLGTYCGEKFALTSSINKKMLAYLPGILLLLLAIVRAV